MIAPAPDRRRRMAPRAMATALGVGLLLAVVTSGGIAGERLTRGAFDVALLANGLATLAALLGVLPTMRQVMASLERLNAEAGDPLREHRRDALQLALAQLLGAAAGIVLVHLTLRRALGANPWLSERPAQFVNDVVAVAGLLALVWAAARGLDARLLVFALVGVTLYRLTAPLWHLDHAPDGFRTSVQELVVAQFVATAVALGLFRTALNRAPG